MHYSYTLNQNEKDNQSGVDDHSVEFDELQQNVVHQFFGNKGLIILNDSNGWAVAYTLRKIIERLPDPTYTSAYTNDPYIRVKTKLLQILSAVYTKPDGIFKCCVKG